VFRNASEGGGERNTAPSHGGKKNTKTTAQMGRGLCRDSWVRGQGKGEPVLVRGRSKKRALGNIVRCTEGKGNTVKKEWTGVGVKCKSKVEKCWKKNGR